MAGTSKVAAIKVYGAAILFTLIIGFSFLGVKTALQTADVLTTLAWRFTFACMGALVGGALMSAWRRGQQAPNRISAVNPEEQTSSSVEGMPNQPAAVIRPTADRRARRTVLLAAIFYTGALGIQATGLSTVTSIISGILFAIVPILTKLLAALFLKERGSWMQNLFIALSVSAVIAMFALGSAEVRGSSIVGMVWLLVASLLMAANNVTIRSVRRLYHPFAIAWRMSLLGGVLFNLMLFGRHWAAGTLRSWFAPLAHPSFILSTLFLGVAATLVSAILMAYMLRSMTAVRAAIFGNLATAITVVAGALFLHEPIGWYHIVCSLLIIVGVAGTSATERPPAETGRR